MKKINFKNNRLVSALAISALALSAFALIYSDTQKVYSDIYEASNSLGELQRERTQKDTALALMEATVSERLAVEGFFLSSDDVVDFIEYAEALSDTTSAEVEVQSVKTRPIKSDETIEELELVISVSGGWAQSVEFFAKLENLPHKSNISRMFMEKDGATEGVWRSEYVVSVLKIK